MKPEMVERVAEQIRVAWCEWARTQPNPKPSWLVPWAELDEQSRDADRHLARYALALAERAADEAVSAYRRGEDGVLTVAVERAVEGGA